MSHSQQLRDPAIKLFGRNIPLPESNIPAIPRRASPTEECTAATNAEHVDAAESLSDSDGQVTGQQTCSQENETELNCSPEEDLGAESDKSVKEKALKKPDKLLPCPRCNSLETKFCYFNNYNVNQPRHFCKNCHRYWTAGGTIRNVPVGAGRRRNQKHSSGPSRQAETNSDEANQPPSSDSPLCESMQIQLNLKETNKIELEEPLESSCSSAAATSSDTVGPGNEDYVAPPWAYPWNPGWNYMMVGATGTSPVMTLPGFCPPNVPFPFLPASYWGFMPGWEAGKWAPPSFGPTSPSNSGCSGNSSPSLGKHSRDTNTPAEENTEPSLWVPKTLRIDDPDEAAKSSIWSTLGIEPDRSKGAVRGSMFKPFIRHKPDAKTQETEADPALHSNPAALSRSHSFQEST